MNGRKLFRNFHLRESLEHSLGFVQEIIKNWGDLHHIGVLADFLEDHNVPAHELFRAFQRYFVNEDCSALENINKSRILQLHNSVLKSFPELKKSEYGNLFGNDSRINKNTTMTNSAVFFKEINYICSITYGMNDNSKNQFLCWKISQNHLNWERIDSPPLEVAALAVTNFICHAILQLKVLCKIENNPNENRDMLVGWDGNEWEPVKFMSWTHTQNLSPVIGYYSNHSAYINNVDLNPGVFINVKISDEWMERLQRIYLTAEDFHVLAMSRHNEWVYLGSERNIALYNNLAIIMKLPNLNKLPTEREVLEINGF